jgi:hypothetical protein
MMMMPVMVFMMLVVAVMGMDRNDLRACRWGKVNHGGGQQQKDEKFFHDYINEWFHFIEMRTECKES